MAGTTLGAMLRSSAAYCLQLSRADPLDWGVAYTSTDFAGLAEANQLREFAVVREDHVPRAYAEVEAHFAARRLTCFNWTAALKQPCAAMGRFLRERGYRHRRLLACVLSAWPEARVRDDLRILPARPLRQQYRQTFFDPGAGCPAEYTELRAAAALERFDDAGYDAQVALLGGRPVGRCALLHLGDVGRVIDFYVLTEHRRQGVGTALLAHVLGIARRVMARTVCLEVEADNAPARACVEHMGFAVDGETAQFCHPDAVVPEYERG